MRLCCLKTHTNRELSLCWKEFIIIKSCTYIGVIAAVRVSSNLWSCTLTTAAWSGDRLISLTKWLAAVITCTHQAPSAHKLVSSVCALRIRARNRRCVVCISMLSLYGSGRHGSFDLFAFRPLFFVVAQCCMDSPHHKMFEKTLAREVSHNWIEASGQSITTERVNVNWCKAAVVKSSYTTIVS